ncbi:MAG: stage III sporulation AC/AD family protein [Lachnospiraceae bacterium]|jgi:stage III sporulation protein AD|nr:stage III sporulation AC/AD family protein [Lachnospiraceae bacterium]
MEIIKIGILGVAGVLFALQFKSEKQEYGIYIGFAVGILIFSFVVDKLADVLGSIELLSRYIDTGSTYFTMLLKVVGITYICEFSSAICKDAGHGTIAGQIEVFGKLSVLLTGIPVLLAIVENINQISI